MREIWELITLDISVLVETGSVSGFGSVSWKRGRTDEEAEEE
jgi:hypothetical protein